jgi:hypothetical protein
MTLPLYIYHSSEIITENQFLAILASFFLEYERMDKGAFDINTCVLIIYAYNFEFTKSDCSIFVLLWHEERPFFLYLLLTLFFETFIKLLELSHFNLFIIILIILIGSCVNDFIVNVGFLFLSLDKKLVIAKIVT